jgi:hypothetical protein
MSGPNSSLLLQYYGGDGEIYVGSFNNKILMTVARVFALFEDNVALDFSVQYMLFCNMIELGVLTGWPLYVKGHGACGGLKPSLRIGGP